MTETNKGDVPASKKNTYFPNNPIKPLAPLKNKGSFICSIKDTRIITKYIPIKIYNECD